MFRFSIASFFLLACFTQPIQGALYVASDPHCVASVWVEDKETYVEGTRVHTVIRSIVTDAQKCPGVQNGEQLNFALPGGTFGGFETRVNGLAIEIGEEAEVSLSDASTSLGVPYLVQARASRYAGEQESGFRCERVPPLGPSLFWRNRTVVMHPSLSYDDRVPQESLIEAMEWAANQWSGHPGSDFGFVIGKPVTQRWVGYDWSQRRPNYNIVTVRRPSGNDFYSEWTHKTNALAMTSITYNHKTGEILDADIEVNAHLYEFVDCQKHAFSCLSRFDTKNMLTHEFGHVAGFDHPDANKKSSKMTMYAEIPAGEMTKRWLSEEDVNGLLFLYPIGKPSPDCFGASRHTQVDFKVELSNSNCRQVSGSFYTSVFLILFFLALLQRRRLFW